jgi:hypothetical protein
MKTKNIAVLVVALTFFSWHAGAQKYYAPPCYSAVNGKVYDVNNSQLWVIMDGNIVKILTNEIVVQTFTIEKKQQAVVVRRQNQSAYGYSNKYHDETKMVDVGTEKVLGRKIIIKNYPIEENTAVGKTINFQAMQTGTLDYNGDKLELWDLGTYPPEDFFMKLKAAQRAAQNQLDEQRRVATEKKDAKKQAVKDNVLNSNQDAADKGDAYGLLRMGERYRDGDGVEKDLAKAKYYLTKAAAAGSPTAADELKRLPAN